MLGRQQIQVQFKVSLGLASLPDSDTITTRVEPQRGLA